MRISTTMQFTNSLSYIQKSNTSVDEASNRYNSGLKFQTAGENPSGMASKVKYEGAISSYKQYAKDGGLAANTLSEEETALQSMWSALSSINTRLIQCVDGSNDQNSLIALAEEIGQTRDHLYDLMNTQNTDGEYIFSGAQSDIPTYTLTSDGHYVCQADGSTRSVLVAPSITVQVSDSGLDVFENCRLADTMTVTATPNIGSSVSSSYGDFGDLYDKYYSPATGANNTLTINVANDNSFELLAPDGTVIETGEVNLEDGTINVKGMEFTIPDPENYAGTIEIELDPPKTDNILNALTKIVDIIEDESISNTDKIAAITEAQVNVQNAMTRYDSYRGKVGARQNTIATILTSNNSLSDIKTESKANVSEVDAFEAASDLIQSQNQLNVSRQIYSMLSKQSLFDDI